MTDSTKNSGFPIQRTARKWALQYLYQLDVSGEDANDNTLAWFWQQIQEGNEGVGEKEWRKCQERAVELIQGVRKHVAELDVKIDGYAVDWDVKRMAAVDRNILRLAAFELLFDETPGAVSIDEALEICRVYGGGEESTAFINGILDRIHNESKK